MARAKLVLNSIEVYSGNSYDSLALGEINGLTENAERVTLSQSLTNITSQSIGLPPIKRGVCIAPITKFI